MVAKSNPKPNAKAPRPPFIRLLPIVVGVAALMLSVSCEGIRTLVSATTGLTVTFGVG